MQRLHARLYIEIYSSRRNPKTPRLCPSLSVYLSCLRFSITQIVTFDCRSDNSLTVCRPEPNRDMPALFAIISNSDHFTIWSLVYA